MQSERLGVDPNERRRKKSPDITVEAVRLQS